MKRLFVNIWNLLIGHFTVFVHSFKKRVTLEYPEKKATLNDRFRGRLQVDISKCAGCGLCQKVCPCVGVIEIEKILDSDSGKSSVASFTIDTAQCIFCGNCVQNCQAGALSMTKDYELAQYEKNALKITTKKVSEEVK